jgi:hypothetical protein
MYIALTYLYATTDCFQDEHLINDWNKVNYEIKE